jgi:hypothetical protein
VRVKWLAKKKTEAARTQGASPSKTQTAVDAAFAAAADASSASAENLLQV